MEKGGKKKIQRKGYAYYQAAKKKVVTEAKPAEN